MWDVQLFKALARLADEGAPIATYTSAGEVRRNLISAGFAMRRSPGYGSKREMLVGHFVPRWRVRRHAPPQPVVTRNRHALVIGAGLAGCAIVERLASRGWHITLIDRADGPAHGASGNPAGVFHPMITRDEGLAARLSRAGFLYALHRWRTLDTDAHPLAWAASGLFQKDDPDVDIDTESGSASDFVPTQAVANNAMPEADDTNTLAPAAVTGQAGVHDPAPGLPHSMARRLDAEQAAVLCGVAPNSEGWFFEQGGWIDPVSLCQAQLAAAATVTELTCLYGQRVKSLNFDNDQWHAIGGNGVTIASADIAIVANAHDVAGIVGLRNVPTESVRGQLTLLPADLFPELATPMIAGAYLSPSPKGAMTGASYGIGDTRTEIDPAEHRENLSRLARLLGRNHAFSLDVDRLAGRVGFRCVTRDRMPMIGPLGDENATRERANSLTGAQLPDLPRMDRLFAAFGYGSRGLIWSALGAELLVSQIEGEPAPLESDLIDAIDPGRFLLRAVRRGKVS
jgi:tRNA 5-methylaminomethyl-2-thiouridine biosynthesis bifunctional protein